MRSAKITAATMKASSIKTLHTNDEQIYKEARAKYKSAKLATRRLGNRAVFNLLNASTLKLLSGKNKDEKYLTFKWSIYRVDRSNNKGRPLSKDTASFASHRIRYNKGMLPKVGA